MPRPPVPAGRYRLQHLMLARALQGAAFIIAVVAALFLRKLPRWGLIQQAVSQLPVWVITTGATVLLVAWAWYVLPERATRWMCRRVGLANDLPRAWLWLVSLVTAPLWVYYISQLASDVVEAIYVGTFLLLLLGLMLKETSRPARARRRR